MDKILVKFEGAEDLKLLGLQIIALIIMILSVTILYRKGVKKINVNGG